MPLTKLHGEQIRLLFTEQHRMWEQEPLKSSLAKLKDDKEAGDVIRSLLDVWEALSEMHAIVSTHPNDTHEAERVLEEAVQKFCKGLDIMVKLLSGLPEAKRLMPLLPGVSKNWEVYMTQ
jgi:hypothetical protein